MLSGSLLQARTAMTTIVRNSSHRNGGVACENMPFSISNKYTLTFWFAFFLGSGFAVPFIAVRHQLLKDQP